MCLLLAIIKNTVKAGVRDQTLKNLADYIPETLTQSRAPNTVKNYSLAFKKWHSWTESFSEVKSLPSKDLHVALYLVNLIQNGESFAVIKNTFYAIKFFHNLGNWKDPCESSLCTNILEAAKRISSKTTNKKQPISVDDLQKIFELCNGLEGSLLELRNLCFIILSFVGFLRFSEVSALKKGNISFHETHMTLFIERSKTDVYRDGNKLYIAKTGSDLCPVSILKLYLEKAKISSDEDYIFRQLSHLKSANDYKLRSANKPISYTTMREQLKAILLKIGKENVSDFSLHSLRSGGASAAANNGVRDRLFKRHGRWKSEKIKDGYVKDNIHSLLSVSLNLGL